MNHRGYVVKVQEGIENGYTQSFVLDMSERAKTLLISHPFFGGDVSIDMVEMKEV